MRSLGQFRDSLGQCQCLERSGAMSCGEAALGVDRAVGCLDSTWQLGLVLVDFPGEAGCLAPFFLEMVIDANRMTWF